MGNIVQLAVSFIGSGAAMVLVTLYADKIRRKWKKEDAQEETKAKVTPERVNRMEEKLDAVVVAQKVITSERIRYLGTCYIGTKKITLAEKENLHEMHNAYEMLGGNGALDTVMEEVDKLPVVDNW